MNTMKINIKLRHFPGCLPRRVQIDLIEGKWDNNPNSRDDESNRRRAKVYKKIRRMNEKARMKELFKAEIHNTDECDGEGVYYLNN